MIRRYAGCLLGLIDALLDAVGDAVSTIVPESAEHKAERHERAFAEGRAAGQQAGLVDQFVDGRGCDWHHRVLYITVRVAQSWVSTGCRRPVQRARWPRSLRPFGTLVDEELSRGK